MLNITHTKSFTLNEPIEMVFPLFSAEGETKWVPNWDYENIMESNELHENYVFLTTNHDHSTTKAIWIVKRYDPEQHVIQFYKVEPEQKVGIISVSCSALSNSITEISVTYEYIGISDEGRKFIHTFTSEEYEKFIDEWKQLLTAYFNTTKRS